MLLYQPTTNEITAATARLKNRHPELGKRIDRASAILHCVDVNFDCDGTDAWNIRTSEHDPWYAVTPTACSCYDFTRHTGASAYYCKHRLAFHGYRHLIQNQLFRRTVGNFKYTSEREQARLQPGSALVITDDRRLRAIAYTPSHKFPRHLCYLRLDSLDRLVPQRLGDYVALAEWLPVVPPFALPQPEPRMEDYHPDRKPAWEQEDFQHWRNTGDTPAMRSPWSPL